MSKRNVAKGGGEAYIDDLKGKRARHTKDWPAVSVIHEIAFATLRIVGGGGLDGGRSQSLRCRVRNVLSLSVSNKEWRRLTVVVVTEEVSVLVIELVVVVLTVTVVGARVEVDMT